MFIDDRLNTCFDFYKLETALESKMRVVSIAKLLAGFLLFGMTGARADLVGSSVDVGVYFPNMAPASLVRDVGTAVVGSGIEYNQGSFTDAAHPLFSYPNLSLDLSGTQGILSFNNTPLDWQGINGNQTFVAITDLSGIFVSAALEHPDDASSFAFTGNTLSLGFFGHFSEHGPIIFDFTTRETVVAPSVPEPSTWAMMILGFCGIGFMAYRKRKNGLSFAT